MNFSCSRSISSRAAALALLGFGLGVVASGPVFAGSPIDAVQTGFEMVDDYLVMKDGKDLDAKIYSSSSTKAILIVPGDMAVPSVILWPRTREVESLKSMKVQSRAGGFVEVRKDAVAAVQPPFSVVGTNVVFSVDGSDLRLKPKPPVLGMNNASQMLEKSAVYARRAEDYAPNQEVLAKLGSLDSAVRVRVFFGTWCPACSQMVPRILSVAEELADSNLDFEFYGLPRGEGFSADPEVRKTNVKSVPTGIVYVDGKEVGRIEGNDWRSPEAAILARVGS